MNLSSIEHNLLYTTVICFSFIGSYHISKWAVTEKRIKDPKKATIFEKIYSYGAALLGTFIIAGFLSERMRDGIFDFNMNKVIAYWIVLSLAAIWGVLTAFSTDNQLTDEQKIIKSKLKQHQDRESDRTFDGRY